MLQSATYRQILGLFLLLGFVLPVSMVEVHHLIDHAEEQAHCEADGNSKHLHSEEYAVHNCLLCTTHIYELSPPELNWQADNQTFLDLSVSTDYGMFIPRQIEVPFLQRGPPATFLWL